MNSVFITNSNLKIETGGGNISYNLALSLHESTNLLHILCKCGGMYGDVLLGEKNHEKNHAPFHSIDPLTYNQPNSPFLTDYLSLINCREIMREYGTSPDIVVIYSDPFGQTVRYLKEHGTKRVICDCAPHNIEESKQEFKKFGFSYNFPHLTEPFLWHFYSEHYRYADKLIVHGKQSGEYIKQKAHIKNDPIVIPHGCNIPDTIPPFPKGFHVGHLGINGLDKGQIYLLEAWKKLNPKLSHLHLAGPGTDTWRNYINNFKLSNTEAHGQIDSISAFYGSIHLYIQPTVTEGFGIPVLEAMAHGRPVICTTGAGACDLIEDGKNGFVIPIRSPDKIIEKITYFLDNPIEIKKMGNNALETAKKWTWDKIRGIYKKVY